MGAKQLRRKSGCAFSCESRDERDVNATELRFQRDIDGVNRGGRNKRKVLDVMKKNFSGGEG